MDKLKGECYVVINLFGFGGINVCFLVLDYVLLIFFIGVVWLVI